MLRQTEKHVATIALGRLMEILSFEVPTDDEKSQAEFIKRMQIILPACYDLLQVLSDQPSKLEIIEAIADFDNETEELKL